MLKNDFIPLILEMLSLFHSVYHLGKSVSSENVNPYFVQNPCNTCMVLSKDTILKMFHNLMFPSVSSQVRVSAGSPSGLAWSL